MVDLVLADAKTTNFRIVFADQSSHATVSKCVLNIVCYHLGVGQLLYLRFS